MSKSTPHQSKHPSTQALQNDDYKDLPQTQSAVIITEFGEPEVMQYKTDVALPPLGDNQVMVKIAYAGINPVDYKTRQGKGWGANNIKDEQFAKGDPAILGFDMAGEVVATNSNKFAIGDRVAAFNFNGGCYGEYNAVDADLLSIVPYSVDLKIAGAVPCAGVTAWQSVGFANILPGEHVVMNAPAGGVGHLALQLLMDLVDEHDVRLTLICSLEKYEKLKKLINVNQLTGWIDYTQFDDSKPFPDLQADVLLDLVGGDAGVKALSTLKSDGRVIMLPSIWVDKLKEAGQRKSLNIEGFMATPNADDLSKVLNHISEGKLKVNIQSTYPLSDTVAAHKELQKGDTFGKIVLDMK